MEAEAALQRMQEEEEDSEGVGSSFCVAMLSFIEEETL
jgi:hypothetical protein